MKLHMGISLNTASLIHDIIKEGKFKQESILQLGKQWCYFNEERYENFCKKKNIIFNSQNNYKWKQNVSDVSFFKSIGYQNVYSFDCSDYENADFIGDLNYDIDKNLSNKFDAIFDGGTLEHIFNLPKFFQATFDMLKVGGIIMHGTPANNFLDHGFYSISPTFYHDYYKKNNFKIIMSSFYVKKRNSTQLDLYEYTPGCLNSRSMGGWGTEEVANWFVAQKIESSTSHLIPNQSNQVETWKDGNKDCLSEKSLQKNETNFLIKKIRDKAKNIKIFYNMFLFFLKIRGTVKNTKLTKIKKIDF